MPTYEELRERYDRGDTFSRSDMKCALDIIDTMLPVWHARARAVSDVQFPIAADAGETQTESLPARARGANKAAVWRVIEERAVARQPVCDRDIELALDMKHEWASGARNALVLAGIVSPVADPNGKRNKLKRLQDGRLVTVSDGPWLTKPHPENAKCRVLVWVPTAMVIHFTKETNA